MQLARSYGLKTMKWMINDLRKGAVITTPVSSFISVNRKGHWMRNTHLIKLWKPVSKDLALKRKASVCYSTYSDSWRSSSVVRRLSRRSIASWIASSAALELSNACWAVEVMSSDWASCLQEKQNKIC